MTRDIDLLSFAEHEAERFVGIFEDICVQRVAQDGLSPDAKYIVTEQILYDPLYVAVACLHLRASGPLSSQLDWAMALPLVHLSSNSRLFRINPRPCSSLSV